MGCGHVPGCSLVPEVACGKHQVISLKIASIAAVHLVVLQNGLPACLLLQAMVSQVSHDHGLLAERISRLTGTEGSARLQAALQRVRQEVLAELQAAEEEAAAGTEADSVWEETSEAGSRPVSR